MFQNHTGEFAGLTVAICWTISALFFEKAGRKIGALSVNIIRLFLSVILLGITCYFTRGMFFPNDATFDQWFWLGLSGFVGFFLGDIFLFNSYIIIGARTSSLIMSLSPMMTAFLGWLYLSEVLTIKSILAIIFSISGIIIAVTNKKMKLNIPIKGLMYALGGALGQSVGFILSKKGMGSYDPFASTQIRAIVGFLCFVAMMLVLRKWTKFSKSLSETKALSAVTIGTIFGPYLGVSLALFALQHTKAGIASTLVGLVPIFIIIPSAIMFKERIKIQQIIGASISIAGSSLFFL